MNCLPKTQLLCLLSFSFVLASCSTQSTKPNYRDTPPSATGKTVNVKKPILISKVFNGRGDLFVWEGKENCQSPKKAPPLFILKKGATLKNLFIKNAPGGIEFAGSKATVENVVFLNSCQAAIRVKGKKQHIAIKKSKFYACQKEGILLQKNSSSPREVEITENEFYGCSEGIKIEEHSHSVRVLKNHFYKNGTALSVSESGSVLFRDNEILDGKIGIEAKTNSAVKDGGGNLFYDVGRPVQTDSSSRILDQNGKVAY